MLDELRTLHEKQQSGVLALSQNDARIDVFYHEGMIQAAAASMEGRRLGDYVLKDERPEGRISSRDLESTAVESKKKNALLGQTAVERGLLAPHELASIVRRQAIDLVQYAVSNKFSVESFAHAARIFYAPSNITYSSLLVELCRSEAEPFQGPVDQLLGLAVRRLPAVDWYPEELAVLGELMYPTSITSMIDSMRFKEAGLRRILGVLDKLGLIAPLDCDDNSAAVVKRFDLPIDELVSVVPNAVPSERLELSNNPSSFISEQFKNLRVRIGEIGETPLKVLTISSPEQQDGKSLISANLALAFSMEPGRRVLIIDCDLRNPSLDRFLGVDNEAGLLQYLSEDRLAAHCYLRRIGRLFFMTSGGIAEHPIELLSLRKMKDLMEHLKTDFDIIILDAPPFGPIADPRVITGLSDGLIVVVRRGKTSYRSLETTFRIIDRQKFVGVVFNDVKDMLFNTYHPHQYYGYRSGLPSGRKALTAKKNYLAS